MNDSLSKKSIGFKRILFAAKETASIKNKLIFRWKKH
jgi:hypothetical protein